MEYLQRIIHESRAVLLNPELIYRARGLHEWADSHPVEDAPDTTETIERYAAAIGAVSELGPRFAEDGLTVAAAAALLTGRSVVDGAVGSTIDIETEMLIGVECLRPDVRSTVNNAAEQASVRLLAHFADVGNTPLPGLESAVRYQGRLDVEELLVRWQEPLPTVTDTPLLARRVGALILRLVDDAIRLADAVDEDTNAVNEGLSVDLQEAAVRTVGPCVGDPHRGRRRSWVLETDASAVYFKQRDLRLDLWYAEFVEWFNVGGDPLLRAVQVVPSGSHGWALGVDARPVERARLRQFYSRYGALVAALDLLGATDIHSSNVVVDGDFPVPVDLECLFHPRRTESVDTVSPTNYLNRLLAEGPLRTGLLPARAPTTDGEGIDVSALGGPAHLGDRQSAVWSDGVIVNPLDYLNDLMIGYQAAVDRLRERFDELKDRESFFHRAEGLPARFIHRDTAVYRRLLGAANDPRWHGTGIDRSVALDRLWGVPADDSVYLTAESVARMFHDDIPYFQVAIGSEFIAAGPLPRQVAIERQGPTEAIERFCDRRRPGHLNEAAVLSSISGLSSQPTAEVAASQSADSLEDWAIDCGLALLDRGLRTSEGVTWMVTAQVSGRWQIGPAGGNLYDGLPGIVMALDALSHLQREGSWAEAANDIARTILYDWDILVERDRGISPFASTAGAALYVAAVCTALDDPLRTELLERSLPSVRLWLNDNRSCDFMSGLPGLIRGASTANQLLGLGLDERLVDAAERLIDLQSGDAEQGPWPTYRGRAIQGLAHGVSGVLLALASIPGAASWPDLIRAVDLGLEYERRSRDERLGGWFDLRRGSDASSEIPAAWCNGAAGIGMVRRELAVIPGLDLADDFAWATDAVSGTVRLRDDALCHGWFGSKLLMSLDGEELPIPAYGPALVMAEPGKSPTAGLMLGTAGVIYAIAHSARPTVTPDLLTLSGPRSTP